MASEQGGPAAASSEVADQVGRHFDAVAQRFDDIYRTDKGWPQRVIDCLFRQVLHRRFELSLELIGDASGKRVLDIGCGSGRYSVELARRGAQVVGIDLAPKMLELARRAAAEAGVAARCEFVEAEFLSWREPGHFDTCLGIGFFDYVEQPRDFLEKVYRAGAPQGIFSFPARWNLRTPTRWLRLALNRCPVYFYGAQQCRDLVSGAGWSEVEVHHLGRDFLIHSKAGG